MMCRLRTVTPGAPFGKKSIVWPTIHSASTSVAVSQCSTIVRRSYATSGATLALFMFRGRA